ncbi:MAG: DUF882 domain-containing protein [Kofleriaceae bacterium]|jgi:uncharacterized protein YcbK (DUF882 family)|nr:DUF882 domain-containing protein [Kofleriaceae bacterium]MBP6839868.1 DUF882 domain-containing protein [Kofleriaceae bacterium]MBP9207443.1 DUF882 domain-containing protein [Kofleriaceae bacterium]
MLLALLPSHVIALVASASLGAAPGPAGAGQLAADVVQSKASAEIAVKLVDVNHDETVTVRLRRDGSSDADTAATLRRLFRCKRTDLEHDVAQGTLAMFADVAARYPGRAIEVVSAYRAARKESATSPHRAARAIDFRVRGIKPAVVRDFLWQTYHDVGVGYYPESGFIHIDVRPERLPWTDRGGRSDYHPGWATIPHPRASGPRLRSGV